MDLETLKTQAADETTRFFYDRDGFSPDPESDEWQDEYRRQFAIIKAGAGVITRSGAGAAAKMPELRGGGTQARYAEVLREERLDAIASADLKAWLIQHWTSAKEWLDTKDLAQPAFQRRAEAQFGDYRRKAASETSSQQAKRAAKARADAAILAKIKAAGITPQGLVELVDISNRIKPAPARDKLAELHAGDRRLRVFETTKPDTLLVLESGPERLEYGIERDEGLVADLKLFAQTPVP